MRARAQNPFGMGGMPGMGGMGGMVCACALLSADNRHRRALFLRRNSLVRLLVCVQPGMGGMGGGMGGLNMADLMVRHCRRRTHHRLH